MIDHRKDFLAELEDRAPGFYFHLLPQEPATAREQETQFSDPHTGKPNLMDVLAWRAIFTKERQLEINRANLTREFDLLTKPVKKMAAG